MNFGMRRVVASVKAAAVMSQMYTGQQITIKELSGKCDLSVSYLEQIFREFRKAGLVTSVRGPGGGYHLENTELNVSDVVRAVTNVGATEFFAPVLNALESIPVSEMNKDGL